MYFGIHKGCIPPILAKGQLFFLLDQPNLPDGKKGKAKERLSKDDRLEEKATFPPPKPITPYPAFSISSKTRKIPKRAPKHHKTQVSLNLDCIYKVKCINMPYDISISVYSVFHSGTCYFIRYV